MPSVFNYFFCFLLSQISVFFGQYVRGFQFSVDSNRLCIIKKGSRVLLHCQKHGRNTWPQAKENDLRRSRKLPRREFFEKKLNFIMKYIKL